MTREEAINRWVMPAIKNTWNEKKCGEIIEALEQEPCEDAVSRQAVLESLNCEINGKIESDIDLSKYKREFQEFANMILNAQEKAIQALPLATHTQSWIPVSERLPKQNGWYQCTVSNDLPRTMELFYKNGKWIDNRRIDMFNTYDIYGYGCTNEKHKLSYQELISEFDWTENVVAWQLLSEPYKAESEDKDADSN